MKKKKKVLTEKSQVVYNPASNSCMDNTDEDLGKLFVLIQTAGGVF